MLFLDGLNIFNHLSRCRVKVRKVGSHFSVTVDGNSLSHEIFSDHVVQRFPLNVLRMAPRKQVFGGKIWRATKLNDALCDAVGVTLLFCCMLEKLGFDRPGMNAFGHKIMPFVPEDAHDLGRQSLVQHLACGVGIAMVSD